MTYAQLMEHLSDLEDEQLDMQVMAYIDEEFFKVKDLSIHENSGTLEDGHPYLDVE